MPMAKKTSAAGMPSRLLTRLNKQLTTSRLPPTANAMAVKSGAFSIIRASHSNRPFVIRHGLQLPDTPRILYGFLQHHENQESDKEHGGCQGRIGTLMRLG